MRWPSLGIRVARDSRGKQAPVLGPYTWKFKPTWGRFRVKPLRKQSGGCTVSLRSIGFGTHAKARVTRWQRSTPERMSNEMPETRQLAEWPARTTNNSRNRTPLELSVPHRGPESAAVTPGGRTRKARDSFVRFCFRSLKHTRSFSHCWLAKSFF